MKSCEYGEGNEDDSMPVFDVVMMPELERLLDEGLEDLDRARTTEEIRHS